MAGQKRAVMNREIRQCFKSANESLLTVYLVWVLRARLNEGRELTDAVNLIMTWQRAAAHLSDIEPLVRRALHTAKIEVETINIDICFDRPLTSSRLRYIKLR